MAFESTDGAAQLQQALQQQNFDEVATLLDELELQVVSAHLPDDWPWIVHLLSHIHTLSLEDARFLWKRIPADKKQDPELRAAFTVLQHLWNKDYEGIWGALLSPPWQPALQPLVASLAARVRAHTLTLLSSAYSNITAARAAALLGLQESETIAAAQQAGWEYEASSALLRVHSQAAAAPSQSRGDHLQRLTELMLHIES